MKKILLGTVILCFTGLAFGQQDLVNSIFTKYSGVEGITSVNITGDMLKMFAQAEQQRMDTTFTSRLSEVRILSLEKSCDQPPAVNFRTEIYDKLDRSVYKEMLSVKQAGEDVVILARELNGRISELLIIAGGQKDNALIQVKGDMLLSEMAGMAGKYQMKGFEHLKELER
jgi:hypothetical protein